MEVISLIVFGRRCWRSRWDSGRWDDFLYQESWKKTWASSFLIDFLCFWFLKTSLSFSAVPSPPVSCQLSVSQLSSLRRLLFLICHLTVSSFSVCHHFSPFLTLSLISNIHHFFASKLSIISSFISYSLALRLSIVSYRLRLLSYLICLSISRLLSCLLSYEVSLLPSLYHLASFHFPLWLFPSLLISLRHSFNFPSCVCSYIFFSSSPSLSLPPFFCGRIYTLYVSVSKCFDFSNGIK